MSNMYDFMFKYIFTLQTGVELELSEQMPLLEWFANNYKNFGKIKFQLKVYKPVLVNELHFDIEFIFVSEYVLLDPIKHYWYFLGIYLN